MRVLLILCLSLLSAFALADDEMRDVKTANPFILLHPESQQAAAEAYYAAVEKNVFNGAIPLKHAQLAAISASVAMKCVYCIPAHTASPGRRVQLMKRSKPRSPLLPMWR